MGGTNTDRRFDLEQIQAQLAEEVTTLDRALAELREQLRNNRLTVPTYQRVQEPRRYAMTLEDIEEQEREYKQYTGSSGHLFELEDVHVIVYRVNGDCMVSAEARNIERNIVHGDNVAVDTRRRPRPGDTVVAWWPDEQKMVVKRYRLERKGIVLYPLAPSAPALVLPHEDDVNVIGVVIWREG